MCRVHLRRGSGPVAALILGATFLVAALADDKPGDTWPLFRGNALQTGTAAAALPEALELRWQFKTKDTIETAPAIAAGTVFVASMDHHLYALDLADGKEKWKYHAGPFKAPPSVDGGAVYIGDADGKFHCVDRASGQPHWTYDVGTEITSGANFAADSVLFGSGDEHLYCLSRSGKQRWRFKIPGGPVFGSPAVMGERAFVAGCDKSLHVIDIAKGNALSAISLNGQTGSAAAGAGERLYLGTMANQVLAVDWKKTEVVWTFQADRQPQPFYSSAALTDTLVIIGSRDKRVHALDRQTGKEVWSFATAGRVDSSPVVAGKRIYVGSLDGHLYVLDHDKGTELHKYKLDSAIFGSPAVAGNCLVIATLRGSVYCFGGK